MADIIRLTAAEVQAVAAKFASASEETEALVGSLSSEVSSMSSGWEGDAYNRFSENFAEIAKKMKDIVEMYQGLGKQLEGVIKTMQETDAGLASSMAG